MKREATAEEGCFLLPETACTNKQHEAIIMQKTNILFGGQRARQPASIGFFPTICQDSPDAYAATNVY